MKLKRIIFFVAGFSIFLYGQSITSENIKAFTLSEKIAFYDSKNEKDISKVSATAEEINVQIEGATKGTGVLIKKDGDRYTVITAWHVIKENRPNEEVGIITKDGKEHIWESKSLKRIGEVDMATFTFTSSNSYQIARIGDTKTISMGNTIFISGYPLANSSVPIRLIRFLKGQVITNTDLSIPDGYQLHYNNDTRVGMSGGSILNIKGELVGIHGRTENNDEIAELTGKVSSTGINMGIPINYYEQFIKPEEVSYFRLKPKTAEDYLAQANALLTKKEDPRKVILLANKSLKLKKIPRTYFVIGAAKIDLYQGKSSIKFFDKAINLDPKYGSAYYSKGVLISRLNKDYKLAIENYNTAIKYMTRDKDHAFNARGVAKENLEDYKGAIEDYNVAIELNPLNDYAFNNRGNSKSKLDDYKGAIEDYNFAIQINPNNHSFYINRGYAKSNLDDDKGAIEDYSIAIKLNPEDASAFAKRSKSKFKLGDIRGARMDNLKAIFLIVKTNLLFIWTTVGLLFFISLEFLIRKKVKPQN